MEATPVPEARVVPVSLFERVRATEPVERAPRWSGLVARLLDFRAPPKTAHTKLDLPAWSPARFDPRHRSNRNVLEVSALVLDFDGVCTMRDAVQPWLDYTWALHTSWSHEPDAPRFRLVLPLDEPVGPGPFSRLWQWSWERAKRLPDRACKDPSRAWLLPVAKPGAPKPVAGWHRGRFLRVEDAPPPPPEVAPPALPPLDLPRDLAERYARLGPSSREEREAVARGLRCRLTSTYAKGATCPSCRRPTAWFWLSPGMDARAHCAHRRSCSWSGSLLDVVLHGAPCPT